VPATPSALGPPSDAGDGHTELRLPGASSRSPGSAQRTEAVSLRRTVGAAQSDGRWWQYASLASRRAGWVAALALIGAGLLTLWQLLFTASASTDIWLGRAWEPPIQHRNDESGATPSEAADSSDESDDCAVPPFAGPSEEGDNSGSGSDNSGSGSDDSCSDDRSGGDNSGSGSDGSDDSGSGESGGSDASPSDDSGSGDNSGSGSSGSGSDSSGSGSGGGDSSGSGSGGGGSSGSGSGGGGSSGSGSGGGGSSGSGSGGGGSSGSGSGGDSSGSGSGGDSSGSDNDPEDRAGG